MKDAKIDEAAYTRAVSQIEEMALAILRGDEKSFIQARVEDLKEEEEKKRKTKELEQRLDTVRRFLKEVDPGNRLQKRYKWKASSKAPSYTTIDWDVKEKIADSKAGSLRFPYATCRIKFQREFSMDPFLLLGGRMFDTVQINFSRDEAAHVVKVFQTVVRELERAEMVSSSSVSEGERRA